MKLLQGLLDIEDQEEDIGNAFTASSYGFSREEAEALQRDMPAPAFVKWKEPDDGNTPVVVSVDHAREEVIANAEKEIEFLLSKLVDNHVLVSVDGCHSMAKQALIDNISDWLFGLDSPFFQAFITKLPIVQHKGHQFFLQCMSIMFQTSALHKSYEQLAPKADISSVASYQSRFSDGDSSSDLLHGSPISLHAHPGLPTWIQYKSFFDALENAGLAQGRSRGQSEVTPGLKPFWKVVQEALNEVLREYTITNSNGRRVIVIDDDKIHFASARDSDRCGLREQNHAADNRRGFTDHHQVLAAAQMLMAVCLESHGESCLISTKEMIKQSLFPVVGENSQNCLNGFSFATDRGYTIWQFIKFLVYDNGADIEASTVRRAPNWIMTYEQQGRPGMVHLERKGPKLSRRRYYNPSDGKKITAHGYQDGKGGIALGCSTRLHKDHFDLVLRNQSDAKVWRSEQNILKWFKPVERIDATEEATSLITRHGQSNVIPLLWENNHAAWFLMRSLSMTSSTIHNLIHYLKRVGDPVRESIGIMSPEWDILSGYLATDVESAAEDGRDIPEYTSGMDEDFEVSMALLQNDEELVSNLRETLDAGNLPEEQVRAYVHYFKGKSTGPISGNGNEVRETNTD